MHSLILNRQNTLLDVGHSMFDDSEIIKKILNHLGLWDVKRKPPPRANAPPSEAIIIYDESSAPSADDYIIDVDYPIQTYL